MIGRIAHIQYGRCRQLFFFVQVWPQSWVTQYMKYTSHLSESDLRSSIEHGNRDIMPYLVSNGNRPRGDPRGQWFYGDA